MALRLANDARCPYQGATKGGSAGFGAIYGVYLLLAGYFELPEIYLMDAIVEH